MEEMHHGSDYITVILQQKRDPSPQRLPIEKLFFDLPQIFSCPAG
jgi:hypothetical protein